MYNTYKIDRSEIVKNYQKFKKAGPVYYPLKSNYNEIVLNILNSLFDEKDKFAISNKNHIKVLKKLGIDNNKYTLINTLYTIEELDDFYELGIRDFVFDNLDIFRIFKEKHQDITCSVRVNINEIYKTDNSFIGASFSDTLKMLNEGCALSIYCPEELRDVEYLEDILIFIKVVNPKLVRFGGFNDDKNIQDIIDFSFEQSIKFVTEPGAKLLENAINLECPVIRIKDKFLIINASIYSGFFDKILCDKKFEFVFENNHDATKKYTICGNSSDCLDVLGEIYLNEENLDNYKNITIKNVGAYFESTNTKYTETENKYIVVGDPDED